MSYLYLIFSLVAIFFSLLLFLADPGEHHWLKMYGYFCEWVYFSYWWSCIGKGLRLQPVQPTCLPTRAKPAAALQTPSLFFNWLTPWSLVKISLWNCNALLVKDSAFSHILSIFTANLMNGWILPICWFVSGRVCVCSLCSRLVKRLINDQYSLFLALVDTFKILQKILILDIANYTSYWKKNVKEKLSKKQQKILHMGNTDSLIDLVWIIEPIQK